MSGEHTPRGNPRRPDGKGRPGNQGFNKGGGGRPGGGRPRRPEPEERTVDQQVYDGPPIPEDISAKDLDRQTRDQLRALPEKLAERIARHLVMTRRWTRCGCAFTNSRSCSMTLPET